MSHVGEEIKGGVLAQFGHDILGNILHKLPAKSFAYAACVSHSWRSVCKCILSRPKLSSALSLNPSIIEAADEVVNKVLSKPILPHFGILYVRDESYLEKAHQFVATKLGSCIPLITSQGFGFLGRDASTGEFMEVFEASEELDTAREPLPETGILLTVGYLPGLKVQLVHLIGSKGEQSSIERFVRDIKDCSASISGSPSPDAIIMFGRDRYNMKPVLRSLDYALSKETIIVGNERCYFTWTGRVLPNVGVAAFIFAKDRYKPDGLGEVQFHHALATGIEGMGPIYKAASVKVRRDENETIWLAAKREGSNEILTFDQISEEVSGLSSKGIMYIGVTKKRRYDVIGQKKVKSMTFMEYHSWNGGDEKYLYLGGQDIKTGDIFRFYGQDKEDAIASATKVSRDMMKLAQRVRAPEEIFGGLIFTCCGRGELFFEEENIDSTPILDNFPEIPVAGVYTCGEIGRGPRLASMSEEEEYESYRGARSCLHQYSSVYLLLSHHPKST